MSDTATRREREGRRAREGERRKKEHTDTDTRSWRVDGAQSLSSLSAPHAGEERERASKQRRSGRSSVRTGRDGTGRDETSERDETRLVAAAVVGVGCQVRVESRFRSRRVPPSIISGIFGIVHPSIHPSLPLSLSLGVAPKTRHSSRES